MSDQVTKRASLAQLRAMNDRGEVHHDPTAPEGGENLGPDFWKDAVVENRRSKSVHLKLDQDVFDYFYQTSGGKGHLTRMRNVLRAYVTAQRKRA